MEQDYEDHIIHDKIWESQYCLIGFACPNVRKCISIDLRWFLSEGLHRIETPHTQRTNRGLHKYSFYAAIEYFAHINAIYGMRFVSNSQGI